MAEDWLAELERLAWRRRLDAAIRDGLDLEGADAVRDGIDDAQIKLPLARRRGRKKKDDLETIVQAAQAWARAPTTKHLSLAADAGIEPSEFSTAFRDLRFWREVVEIFEYQQDRQSAEEEDAARDLDKRVEKVVRARLPQWIADHWAGPVRSMFDGATYPTAESYAAHLRKVARWPVELEDEVRAELHSES